MLSAIVSSPYRAETLEFIGGGEVGQTRLDGRGANDDGSRVTDIIGLIRSWSSVTYSPPIPVATVKGVQGKGKVRLLTWRNLLSSSTFCTARVMLN